MAPEMVELLNSKAKPKGYDHLVDWWSLAVTTYVLLTGSKPFPKAKHADLFVDHTFRMEDNRANAFPEYDVLLTPVTYPSYLSAPAVDFIASMLVVDENRRLSSGPDGAASIKSHPFFQMIDWDLLLTKRIIPPFIPEIKSGGPGARTDTFKDFMTELGFKDWLESHPSNAAQSYFQKWSVSFIQRIIYQYDFLLSVVGILFLRQLCEWNSVLLMKWSNMIEI